MSKILYENFRELKLYEPVDGTGKNKNLTVSSRDFRPRFTLYLPDLNDGKEFFDRTKYFRFNNHELENFVKLGKELIAKPDLDSVGVDCLKKQDHTDPDDGVKVLEGHLTLGKDKEKKLYFIEAVSLDSVAHRFYFRPSLYKKYYRNKEQVVGSASLSALILDVFLDNLKEICRKNAMGATNTKEYEKKKEE